MQDTKTAAIMALAQDYAISYARSIHMQSQPEDEARTERARLALLAEVSEAKPVALPARLCCNEDCDWYGSTDRMVGNIGPLCPKCGETTELDTSATGKDHHAALQRIGTALGLLPGANLHAECVPAIHQLRASVSAK